MPGLLLQDQVVLMIGAGRGPGPALARALAAEGALIAANDLSPVLLDPLVAQITTGGGRAQAYTGDATRGMPLRALLDEVLENLGRIDILVNNPRIRPEAALIEMDEYDWQRTVEMNLNGPFLVMQLVGRLMREQGGGVILNLVDEAVDASLHGAYQASQAGLMALSQAAAREFMAYNIRVHTLCLGGERANPTGPSVEMPGKAQSLNAAAIFLCSPQAAHLTGQSLPVSQLSQETQGEE